MAGTRTHLPNPQAYLLLKPSPQAWAGTTVSYSHHNEKRRVQVPDSNLLQQMLKSQLRREKFECKQGQNVGLLTFCSGGGAEGQGPGWGWAGGGAARQSLRALAGRQGPQVPLK